jgi:cyclophilin family peptidyl-prolyl cis-trans isomerase/HEAT repeat protein
MNKALIYILAITFVFSLSVFSQVPIATQVKIVKAEDERLYDKTLEDLLKDKNEMVRARAALAAGRIGDEKAIPALADMLKMDPSQGARAMAAFALGETESMPAADAILEALTDPLTPDPVRGRVVEAAGKIVAANAAKGRSKMIDNLGDAILDTLKQQAGARDKQDRNVILLGITAALRAHARTAVPGLTKEEIEAIDTGGAVAPFLTNSDARIRTDAANTISRARYKKANDVLRKMLQSEPDGAARANAATALGRADDKGAVDMLLTAATGDKDSRVRVSAIRALGTLRDAKTADKLVERGIKLMSGYTLEKLVNPPQKNELLEIATVLGRLMQGTGNEPTIKFLKMLRAWDRYTSGETETALARVSPETYLTSLLQSPENNFGDDWRATAAAFQAIAEVANLEKSPENDAVKAKYRLLLVKAIGSWVNSPPGEKASGKTAMAVPDMLRAFAAFKSENTSGIIRPLLEIESDIMIRAAAAGILADQPPSKENTEALKKAFDRALLTDKTYNDAQIALLDALFKVDKKESVGTLTIALNAQDHLVRKKAMELLSSKELLEDFPGIPTILENAKAKGKDRPLTYNSAFGTKLGSVLNTTADYTRAVSRKNGSVRAVISTSKESFTIEFFPEEAPLTVDNFVKLARAGYFNGVLVHRVAPNFVMQDGDPRGDGNGGPGWSIRCEVNMSPYDRGAVGMALSGKDTGGSQWFVTHTPTPHLDGGYTVFGHVDEAGMKVVDDIARGDKIVSVKIIEGGLPRKGTKGRK